MKKFAVVFGLILCLSAQAEAKRAPLHELPFQAVDQFFKNLEKKGSLNPSHQDLIGLINLAGALKVDKFLSPWKDPGQINITSVHLAITSKMQERPTWDVSLSPDVMKQINSKQTLLKKVFGENSYEWAWFLKQRGEKAQSKKVLTGAFEATSKKIDQMQTLDFGGQSPLRELELQREALGPMSDTKEKARLDEKLQKAKIHLSNLPDSMIKT